MNGAYQGNKNIIKSIIQEYFKNVLTDKIATERKRKREEESHFGSEKC